MIRMNHCLAALFLCAAPAAQAAPLSQADCDAIFATYGIVPNECPAAPGIAVAGIPALTDRQIESNIFFVAGGTTLDAAANARLERLALVLETAPLKSACLRFVGYADAPDQNGKNLALSARRAEVVADYLRKRLAQPARILAASGAGDSDPLPGFPATADENRRVAIFAGACP